MSEIALRRSLSRSVACFDTRQWGQGDISRGLQDKSRKVRPVGWVRKSANFRLFRNIARVSRNLRFSATHYRPTTF